jgi:DNA-binding MarR family transcriptional regulator
VAYFYPAGDDQARLRWGIIDALRRYGTDSGRIGHAFAELHRLQPADLRALVAIMSAEGNGTPLTAGQLREQLGLSSGGASLVIDRLEQAGHIRRARDHPADNRVVHLRYTDQGKATGLAFFGSLGDRAHAILDGFTEDELQVIARFITAMADSARQHVRELEARLPGMGPAVAEEAAARPVVGQRGGPDDPGHAGRRRPGAHGLGAGPGRGEVGVEGIDDDRSAIELGRQGCGQREHGRLADAVGGGRAVPRGQPVLRVAVDPAPLATLTIAGARCAATAAGTPGSSARCRAGWRP